MERRHFLKLTFGFFAGASVLAAGAEAAPLPPVTPEGQGLVPQRGEARTRDRDVRTMSIVLRRTRCGGDAAGAIAGVIGVSVAAGSGAAAIGASAVAGSGAVATGAAVTGEG